MVRKRIILCFKSEEKRKEFIQVEDRINLSSIVVLLVNGCTSDLPFELAHRNANSIKEFEYFGNFLRMKSKNYYDDIGDRIDEIYKLYMKYSGTDFSELCNDIPFPSDPEISEWIRKQKATIRTKINQSNYRDFKKDIINEPR